MNKINQQKIYHFKNNNKSNCSNNNNLMDQKLKESQEKSMWRAVITQALMDAASRSQKKSEITYKMKALLWLLQDDGDFYEVCHYADFDPVAIRIIIREVLKNGCKWRKDKRSDLVNEDLMLLFNHAKQNNDDTKC